MSTFILGAVLLSFYFVETLQTTRAHSDRAQPALYPERSNKLIISFDDGPDPVYTRQIMDILEEHDVPGTFFFIGKSMLLHPEVVREAYTRGFEIGNHTYTHSLSVHSSKERIGRELNATDKILEQTLGRSSIIYRPPYLLDFEYEPEEIVTHAERPDTVNVFKVIDDLGYIVVGADVDSLDWKATSPEEIIETTLAQAKHGNVILFHDGGNDRSDTVAALPIIITKLRAAGYEFVSVGDLISLTRDEVMPPRRQYSLVDQAGYTAFVGGMGVSEALPPVVIYALLVITAFRILFLLILAAFAPLARRPALSTTKRAPHGVSVLVPAYNEADNIEGTLKSVAQSTYFPREIIVIDDGSTDTTSEIVRGIARKLGEDLTLIRKANGGKAAALNAGLKRAKYGVLVAIDGDTVIHKEAIARLVAHFADTRVGAVAGKIEAIGAKTWVQAFQNLEYTVSQNIDKTVFGFLGAVGVIPGAIGAWRRSDVIRAGGYTDDTLVEDQDLTLAIHALGQTVEYEPQAIAYTEVPEHTRSFFKQRFRWVFGGLQCLWKYRTSLFSKRSFALGWVILPYNLMYTFIVPILQLTILATVFLFIASAGWQMLLAGFAFFFFIDIIYAAAGLLRDSKKAGLILYLPLQRTYYATFAMVIMFLSLVKIVEGTRALWNRFERTGSAQKFFEEALAGLGATSSLPTR